MKPRPTPPPPSSSAPRARFGLSGALHGSPGSVAGVAGSGFAFAVAGSGVGAVLLAGAGVVGAGLALQPGVPSIAPATTTVRQIVWVLSRMVSVLSGGLGRCNRHRQARSRWCGTGCLGHQAAHAMYALRDDRLRHLGPLGEQPLDALAGDPQRARAFEAADARRARRRVEHGHLAEAGAGG